MFKAPRTIIDDRGREFTSTPPATPPAADHERGEAAAYSGSGCVWWGAAGGIGAVLAVGCCSRGDPEVGIAAALIVLFSCGLLGLFSLRRASPPRVLRVLLTDWLLVDTCPGCGYALGGLREQGDGCVECPECGAAWALARWKRDHPRFASDILDGMTFPKGSVSCWETDARGRGLEVQPLLLPAPAATRARQRMWIALGATGLTVAGAWFMLRATGAPPEAAAIGVVILGAVLGMAALEVGRGERIAARRAMIPGQLARGECPRCLEALPEREAVSDGARVCGRCGAAWPAPTETAGPGGGPPREDL